MLPRGPSLRSAAAAESLPRDPPRRVRGGQASAIITALAAAGALSALPDPGCGPIEEGPLSAVIGPLTIVRDIGYYFALARGAQSCRIPRFGNACVGTCVATLPKLTAPGGVAVTVDASPEALLHHGHGILAGASAAGVNMTVLQVGKFSIYGPGAIEWNGRVADRWHIDPRNPLTWNVDSARRLAKHYEAAPEWALTVILGVFTHESNALDAERFVIDHLGALTNLTRLNRAPYTTVRPGRRDAFRSLQWWKPSWGGGGAAVVVVVQRVL